MWKGGWLVTLGSIYTPLLFSNSAVLLLPLSAAVVSCLLASAHPPGCTGEKKLHFREKRERKVSKFESK